MPSAPTTGGTVATDVADGGRGGVDGAGFVVRHGIANATSTSSSASTDPISNPVRLRVVTSPALTLGAATDQSADRRRHRGPDLIVQRTHPGPLRGHLHNPQAPAGGYRQLRQLTGRRPNVR